MTQTRLLINNACYLIYVRGNQKQIVFKDKENFKFYLHQLKHYKRKHLFRIYGYCLTSNHIHLMGELIYPEKLPKFMQYLQRSYTTYYNKKYNKVGHLWQDRFKTKVIVKDAYLLDCIAYAEQNPMRANLAKSIRGYEFSSYCERNSSFMKCFGLVDKLLF